MDEALGASEEGLEPEQQQRLEHLCGFLRQGDLLRIYAFSVLGAPEATLNDDTREGAETAEFRVTSIERRLESGLWAILSQTCDMRRDLTREPFLQIAPLYAADREGWENTRGSLRSNSQFAYPPIEAEIDHPILDIRIIQTIEKTAIVADGVEPFDPGLDQRFRTHLATWLARRLARHAFPDPLEDAVLDRLRQTARKMRPDRSQPAGALLASLDGIWVSYNAESAFILFVTSQSRIAQIEALRGDADKVLQIGVDQIMTQVAKRNTHCGEPYQLTWRFARPEQIRASHILYHAHPLDLS